MGGARISRFLEDCVTAGAEKKIEEKSHTSVSVVALILVSARLALLEVLVLDLNELDHSGGRRRVCWRSLRCELTGFGRQQRRSWTRDTRGV